MDSILRILRYVAYFSKRLLALYIHSRSVCILIALRRYINRRFDRNNPYIYNCGVLAEHIRIRRRVRILLSCRIFGDSCDFNYTIPPCKKTVSEHNVDTVFLRNTIPTRRQYRRQRIRDFNLRSLDTLSFADKK
jgi:hypothetical protein